MTNFLNWPNWEVTEVLGFQWGLLIVKAQYLPTFKVCPDCVAGSLRPNGKKTVDFADAPVRGQPVVIRADVQRYRCQNCGVTPFQQLPDIDPSHRMTRRCTDYIRQQVLRKTFAEVARETGVNEKTIRVIGAERRNNPIEFPTFAPRILGIDEVKVAGKLRGVFTDLEGRHILDVTESSAKSAVVQWLSSLVGPGNLIAVCIDGWSPYRDAVIEVFGHDVQIVSDKFHILRTANHCMHMAQKRSVQLETPASGRDTRRRQKRVLLKRDKNLTHQEQITLNDEIQDFPLLKRAYDAKEAFFAIYDHKSRPAAERALSEWEAGLAPDLCLVFQPLLTTINNWRAEILAYWNHRVTNAFTEAANGQIKRIAHNGRGYSFPEIRTRILEGYPPEPTVAKSVMLKRAAEPRRELHT
jgi:transposase